ncbi:MAG: hypothetical protein M5F18_10060 [Asgard group archaeon]|nr:hypothetical protein [Asgard group archaeon]
MVESNGIYNEYDNQTPSVHVLSSAVDSFAVTIKHHHEQQCQATFITIHW